MLNIPSLITVKNTTPATSSQKETRAEAKLFYKMDEAVKLTGVDKTTIEAWEKEFPFLTSGVTGTGQKFFRAQDVDIIRRIKELLAAESLTLAGVRRKIEAEFGLAKPLEAPPEKMRQTLLFIRDELEEMLERLARRPGGKKG